MRIMGGGFLVTTAAAMLGGSSSMWTTTQSFRRAAALSTLAIGNNGPAILRCFVLLTSSRARSDSAAAFSLLTSPPSRRGLDIGIGRATMNGCRALSSSTTSSKSTSSETTEEGTVSTSVASTSLVANGAGEADAVDSSLQQEDAAQAQVLANLQSTFLKTMRDRGFLHQCTAWTDLDKVLCGTAADSKDEKSSKVVRAYLGFDATADSLHVGSLLQIMILRWFQRSGHQPIVLLGGGTSKVGDPTGKDESRILLTDQVIENNIRGISQVFAKFLTLAPDNNDNDKDSTSTDAIIVNNNDWLSKLSYLDFLRDYGTQFTINRMLSFESVKQRLSREAPFSFLEFNYMILQAYDFLELHRRYHTKLQLGGSDQWGNMIAGVELGRKVDGAQLFALTAPLITTSDGKKMGKTASGAVWLNADRLSPYEYWQFWRNTADQDVIRFLKLFTELPLEEIDEMSHWTGNDINRAKIVLADHATELLHGKDVLPGIHETIAQMFATTSTSSSSGGTMKTEGLVRVQVTCEQLRDGGVRIVDLLAELGLAPSKKEARRLIGGGGARKTVGDDEVKIDDELAVLTEDDFAGASEVVLRAGKKRAGVVELVAE